MTAATQVVTQIGFGFVIPFLPLYVQDLGVTDRSEVALWSGVLAGAAAFPMALMAPVWGGLADRYGRKLMVVRSMLGGALLVGGMGFVHDTWQLLGLRLLQGAITGSVAAGSALVAAATPAAHLGFALGLVNTAIQTGNSLGPALGGLVVGGLGYRATFVAGGALLGVAGVVAAVWLREPPRPPARVGTVAQAPGNLLVRTLRPFTWPRFRLVLTLQVATQFAFSASSALLALYLQDMPRPGWLTPELGAGAGLAITATTAAVAMAWLGRWTDRHGPHRLLLASLLSLAAALVLQGLLPQAGVFLVLRGVTGLSLAGLTASLGVLTKTAAPVGREGAAFGTTAAAQAFGWGLGPILGSAVAAVAGIPALYVLCGVAVAAVSYLARPGGSATGPHPTTAAAR